MVWYTAHYGTWANGGHVERIVFGKYCYGTFDRKEAFTKAKETANRTAQKVIIMWDIPTGSGLKGFSEEILPD